MGNPQLSVIIPAYNESRYISGTVQSIINYLKPRYSSFEVIVVDDGSQDGTAQVLEKTTLSLPRDCSVQVLRNETNQGKGYSIQRGMQTSSGKIVFFTDADLAYDLSVIDLITQSIRNGADVAIGSRFVTGSQIQSEVPFLRHLSGKIFNLLVRLLLFSGISDTQCGVKGFSQTAAKAIFPRQTMRHFSFDVEVIFIARQLGLSIVQVPVKLSYYRNESRVRIFADSWDMLKDILSIRWKGWRGEYQKSLPQEV